MQEQNVEAIAGAVGQTVKSVTVENEDLRILFTNGSRLFGHLDADCCSSSYFTEDAKEDAWGLIGSTILAIEERDENAGSGREYPRDDGEISWHFLVITTDKGHVTLDWRNDSNGYYDGSIDFSFREKDGS